MYILRLIKRLKGIVLSKENVSDSHIERFTKCDKCEYLEICKQNESVLECTTSSDMNGHYIKGIGVKCILEES